MAKATDSKVPLRFSRGRLRAADGALNVFESSGITDDMVTDLVETISSLRTETAFIPPVILGYVGHLSENNLIYIASLFSLVGAVYMYKIMEFLSELEDDEALEPVEILLLFPQNKLSLIFFLSTTFWYAITIPVGYFTGLYFLNKTGDFYLFLGIGGYTLWLLLMFLSIDLSKEPTELQLRVIHMFKSLLHG